MPYLLQRFCRNSAIFNAGADVAQEILIAHAGSNWFQMRAKHVIFQKIADFT